MQNDQVSRRQWLAGSALVGAGVALSRPAPAAEHEEEIIAFPFAQYRELTRPDGWVAEKLQDGTIVVLVRIDDDTLTCASRDEPPGQSKLEYDPARKSFVCPDDGTVYDLRGTPTDGPGTVPLILYPADLACVIRRKK